MSKALPASCVGGIVTAGGVPVPAADILSEGVGPSEGVLILDEDEAKYIAKTSPDLKATLEQLISALDKTVEALGKASSALTGLDTAGFLIAATAGVPSPPLQAANIAGITTASAEITAAKVQLTALKGMLK